MASSSSSQFIKGASRRRAAPGSRCVEVAARAATCPASNAWFSREKDREGQPTRQVRFHLPVYSGHPAVPGSEGLWFAPTLRRRSTHAHGAPPQASAKFAHACPAWGTLWRANTRHRPRAFIKKSAVCERELMSLGTKRPNPSIKRTVKGLRPSPAAYVKR